MSQCQPQARDELQSVARSVRACPAVVAADVLAPVQTPRSRWSLEIVVEGATVPPRVRRPPLAAGLALDPAASGVRGEPAHATLVYHLR